MLARAPWCPRTPFTFRPPYLPKARSGKIMRRVLRKIAVLDTEDLRGTSTLEDPAMTEGFISSTSAHWPSGMVVAPTFVGFF